ncbi:TonB family C-terminal domain-containing protein [Alteromonadaceae bacterium Bs31]|nr:TonB family C-terminal domain-containing protein [Alteromonadaceae bacterium Bs31]
MSLLNNKRSAIYLVLFTVQAFFAQAFAEPRLNGLSIHSELGKERFIAGLSVTTLSSQPRDILIAQEDKRIQVRILAERLSARSFKRMWIEGMAINASSSELTDNAQNMADFSNLLKIRLVAGDIFTVDRRGDSVYMILNGTTLGEVADTAFFDLLLRTWIGPVPLSSDFRSGLLAAGNIEAGLLARFDGTYPSEERIAAVERNAGSSPTPRPAIAATAPAAAAIASEAQIDAPAPPPVTAPQPDLASSAPISSETPELTQIEAPQAPETEAAVPATPEPTAPPKASVTQQALLDDDFFEEDEDDLEFTAEGLLKQQLYISNLKRYSQKYLSYPQRAIDRNWQGTVRLSITIDREGKLQDVVVIEKAKHASLNKAAVKATKKASPFPPMPEEIRGEQFAFTLPVVFQLRESKKK